MKKKGFTLIELLATIVVLSVIALIATPIILNVIEKAKKGALVSSVNGLVESANMYYTNEIIKGDISEDVIFDFEEGIQTSNEKLSYKGKVYNGKLILTSDSKVTTCIDDGKYYAYKEADSDEVISGIGTCLYDGTTGDFTIESDTELLECENDKALLEQSIKELEEQIKTLNEELNVIKGEKETLEETIKVLEDQIAVKEAERDEYKAKLEELNEKIANVTATSLDVLSGKTILTSSGLVTGTMTNKSGTTTAASTVTESGDNALITIPEKGYYDTSSKISVPMNEISSITSGSALKLVEVDSLVSFTGTLHTSTTYNDKSVIVGTDTSKSIWTKGAATFVIKLKEKAVIKMIEHFQPKVATEAAVYGASQIVVEGSNDNSTWTTIETLVVVKRGTETAWFNQSKTAHLLGSFDGYNDIAYQYYKIKLTPPGEWCNIGVQLFYK